MKHCSGIAKKAFMIWCLIDFSALVLFLQGSETVRDLSVLLFILAIPVKLVESLLLVTEVDLSKPNIIPFPGAELYGETEEDKVTAK